MGMDSAHLARVQNFTVGRDGQGAIRWFGETDIRSLPLNEIVSIENNEVCVISV